MKKTWSVVLTEDQYKRFEELTYHLYKENKISQPKKNKVIQDYLLMAIYNNKIK